MSKNTTKNNQDLQKSLLEIGLTNNEANVYLAGLRLGATSVLQIARAANTKRTTVYSVVNELVAKNLFEVVDNGFKKKYKALPPKNLESFLASKVTTLENNIITLESIYNQDVQVDFISIYQGKHGVLQAYDKLLNEVKIGDYYYVIANQNDWYNIDQDYFQSFIERRSNLGLDIKLLLQDSGITRRHQQLERNFNEQIKILKNKNFIDTNIVITPKVILTHQLKSQKVFFVRNKSIVNTYKELFEMLWDVAD